MQHFKSNEFMKDLLTKINHENKKSIIAGDFNLNLLKYTQIRYEFLKCLLNKNFLPQITFPTQVAQNPVSLIDNSFIKSDKDMLFW